MIKKIFNNLDFLNLNRLKNIFKEVDLKYYPYKAV